jgi:outer membrane protein OmpA-like peptidoglycan-associated protein
MVMALSAANDSLIITQRTVTRGSGLTGYAVVGAAINVASFSTMPGVESCCTKFIGTNGRSIGAGVTYDVMSFGSRLTLRANAGLISTSSPMVTVSNEIIDFQGDAYDAEIQHNLTMSLTQAIAGIDAAVDVASWLRVSLGLGVSLPIAQSYALSEELISPDNVRFETGTTVRNERTGSSASTMAALYVPLGIEGPSVRLVGDVYAQPIVGMQYWITSVNSATPWSLSSIHAGLRLSIQRTDIEQDTQRIIIQEPDKPTLVVERQKMPEQVITITGGVRDTITNTYRNDVAFTYNVKRRRLAVLPSIFFDSASAAIPNRFLQRRVMTDSGGSEGVRDIDVSHSILHVLGTTMQRQPDAVVTITGCHAEDVVTDDRNGLARGRAESVKSYLMSEYRIDSSRCRIVTRAFPERASSVFTPFGRAENRRVDIELLNTSYDLPVQPDTLVVVSPIAIEAFVQATRPETIQNVRLSLLADGVELASNDTVLSSVPLSSPFVLTETLKRKLLQSKLVEIAIRAIDSVDGGIEQRVKAFNIAARPDDEQPFDEFGIVLFDYNSSRIAETERRVIDDLKKRVSRADRISITGTSDESGSEIENLRLAEERAVSVARALGLKPGSFELRSRIATDYSSFIPEGRMLGRQVKVVLQTGKK